MPLTSFNFLSKQYHEQIFSNAKRGNINKYSTFQLYTKKKVLFKYCPIYAIPKLNKHILFFLCIRILPLKLIKY